MATAKQRVTASSAIPGKRELNPEMRSHLNKYWLFLLGTSIFHPYKFSGTEPSNFFVMGCPTFDLLAAFTMSSDITVARQTFATLDAGLLSNVTAEGRSTKR
ncbi:hypothetical protein QUB60_10270 [Microcoleus sp. A2-C5]|uniref:hypothetical protein n=1 Tax=unclassified Microcoleus TaxID=2642155 RepID=UPI002FD79D35